MRWMFGGSAYLFAIIKYFSFALLPFIPFATKLFSTPVTSSNLCNQAPLFTELRLSQGTHCGHKILVLFATVELAYSTIAVVILITSSPAGTHIQANCSSKLLFNLYIH